MSEGALDGSKPMPEGKAALAARLREVRLPYPPRGERVNVRMSMHVTLPGQPPIFIEGMSLNVDRYMYERYEELGELDKWMHFQVVQELMKHSSVNSVALEVP